MLAHLYVTIVLSYSSLLATATPLDRRVYPEITTELIVSLPSYWENFAKSVDAFPQTGGTLQQAKDVSSSLEKIVQPYIDLSDTSGIFWRPESDAEVSKFTEEFNDARCKILAVGEPALRKLISLADKFTALDPSNNLVNHLAAVLNDVLHGLDKVILSLPYIEYGHYKNPDTALAQTCPEVDTRALWDAYAEYHARSS